MSDIIPRIGPRLAHDHMTNDDALLVCAYDDDTKFTANRLENAISLSDLKDMEGSLSKDQEIIFYCG